MFVQLVCPQCGQPLEIDEKKHLYFCPYCGTKILEIKEEPTIKEETPVFVASDSVVTNPVTIIYHGNELQSNLNLRLPSIGKEHVLYDKDEVNFEVQEGIYLFEFSVGDQFYVENITIHEGDELIIHVDSNLIVRIIRKNEHSVKEETNEPVSSFLKYVLLGLLLTLPLLFFCCFF